MKPLVFHSTDDTSSSTSSEYPLSINDPEFYDGTLLQLENENIEDDDSVEKSDSYVSDVSEVKESGMFSKDDYSFIDLDDMRNFCWNMKFQTSIQYLRYCDDHANNWYQIPDTIYDKRIEGFHGLFKGRLDIIKAYYELTYLGRDFSNVAEMYGKVIISEKYLHPREKTISPVKIPGMAGGEKYIVSGILFKFAVDTNKLYNGDIYAAKSSGHDLKSLNYLFSVKESSKFSMPLITLINYRGFRLECVSLLPLSKNSIVYGSSDGGHHVFASDERVNNLVRDVATNLNLKGHMSPDDQFIYFPADAEIHISQNDGRIYVLDLARLFPPHHPLKDHTAISQKLKNAHLYRLMRPELVNKWHTPLSSDGCCSMGRHDRSIHDKEIYDTTISLLDEIIPEATRILDSILDGFVFEYDPLEWLSEIKQYLHLSGVNMRYLGLVYIHSESKLHKSLLRVEIIARTVKNIISNNLSSTMQKNQTFPLEEPFMRCIIDTLNIVLENSNNSKRYWSKEIYENAMLWFFVTDITEFDIVTWKNEISTCLLFRRIVQLTGINFCQSTIEELSHNPTAYNTEKPIDILDIISVQPKLKGLNIITHSEGMINYYKAKQLISSLEENKCTDEENKRTTREICRLLLLAAEKFESSLDMVPSNSHAQLLVAEVMVELAKRSNNDPITIENYYAKACMKYSHSSYLIPDNFLIMKKWGMALLEYSFNILDPEKRNVLIEEALTKLNQSISLLQTYDTTNLYSDELDLINLTILKVNVNN